jgi:hypothetical protein
MMRTLCQAAVAATFTLAAAGSLAAGPAAAPQNLPQLVSLVNTPAPGGFLGLNGFDVFQGQSVAARFTVPASSNFRLARVGIWFMNNSDSEQYPMRISVQTDALDEGGNETLPSGRRLATWVTTVKTLGWNPLEQFFRSTTGPRLRAGANYWVVAESDAPPFVDPVWTISKKGTAFSTTTYNGAWQTAGSGAAPTLQVDAVAVD